jgi:hypothetical protein
LGLIGNDGIISTSAEERKAFLADTSQTSDEEESDGMDVDFFSNAEFLGARVAHEKRKRENHEETKAR